MGRGWILPSLACGDLVEFADRQPGGAAPRGWCGLVDSYDGAGWLIVQDPYPTPDAAHTDAERLLGAHRYQPAVTASPARCSRTARRHRPHR